MGLHSGAPVDLRILPAAAGSGVVFRRTDLDSFEMEAVSKNVARVSYATSLMKKGVFISTTEHLLSALIGCGIDNAIVELNNLELPILDGSALPFVEAILKAGIRKQRRPRTYLRIRRELEVREGDKFIAVYPADTYSVSYAINFPHPLIGKETFRVDLSDGNYLTEIAAARTFGFLHEAEAMRLSGWGTRGGFHQKVRIGGERQNEETTCRKQCDRFCPACRDSCAGPGFQGFLRWGKCRGRVQHILHIHNHGFQSDRVFRYDQPAGNCHCGSAKARPEWFQRRRRGRLQFPERQFRVWIRSRLGFHEIEPDQSRRSDLSLLRADGVSGNAIGENRLALHGTASRWRRCWACAVLRHGRLRGYEPQLRVRFYGYLRERA